MLYSFKGLGFNCKRFGGPTHTFLRWIFSSASATFLSRVRIVLMDSNDVAPSFLPMTYPAGKPLRVRRRSCVEMFTWIFARFRQNQRDIQTCNALIQNYFCFSLQIHSLFIIWILYLDVLLRCIEDCPYMFFLPVFQVPGFWLLKNVIQLGCKAAISISERV